MARSSSNLVGVREEIRPQSRQRPLSAVYPCSESSHHRQWTADFGKPSTSAVIIVKKSKKEPDPPQRSVSLRSQPAKHPSSKRYSCPAVEFHSSSPSISTCSSAPLVQTSMITGPDPLGWKLHRKPGNTSSRSPTARLSLQIPLSFDVFPEKKSQLSSNSNPSETKEAKLSCRHNSDSLASLRSLGTTLPVTTDELCAIKLRHSMSDSDAVFCEENTEEAEQRTKKPPPVPLKTEKARQTAQLIAFSQQLSIKTKSNKEEPIYRVLKTETQMTDNPQARRVSGEQQ